MKFGVITFPGSNCDRDLWFVLEDVLSTKVVRLWHKDTDLQGCDFIFLPGGFSYGDYLRSGAIARFASIMPQVIEFANKGGYVMGICNGFQILTEAGLLPGALLHNTTGLFICENTFIRPTTNHSLLTQSLSLDKGYSIPIAHGEGNYYCDESTLKQLLDEDLILFQYSDSKGEVSPATNPNGSLLNIAGITNKNRNVFGMMPHPERTANPNFPIQDGLALFESILANA